MVLALCANGKAVVWASLACMMMLSGCESGSSDEEETVMNTNMTGIKPGFDDEAPHMEDSWCPEIGHQCKADIEWAMNHGIYEHPEWYHGLTSSSSEHDFRCKLKNYDSTACFGDPSYNCYACSGPAPSPPSGSSSGSCSDRLNIRYKSSSACIVVKDSKVLLIKSNYFQPPNSWDLPGGTHEGEESACETAERETCEEGQITVKVTAKTAKGNVFICEEVGPGSCHSPETITGREYFGADNLPDLRNAWGNPNAKAEILEALRQYR